MRSTLLILALLVTIPAALSANPFVTERRDGNVWVRSVVHDDGSYTVSKQDLKNKNQVVIERRKSSGYVVSKTILDLDSAGRHRRGQVFDGQDRLRFVSDFVYDDFKRLKEEQIRNSQNRLVTRIVYEYDSAGNPRPMAYDYTQSGTARPRAVTAGSEWSTTNPNGYTGVPAASGQGTTAPSNSNSAVSRRARLFGGSTSSPSNTNSSGQKKRYILRPWKNR